MPHIDRGGLHLAISDAIDAYVNGRYPHLPPLRWIAYGQAPHDELVGQPEGDDVDTASVQAWAEALDLPSDPHPTPGAVSYVGDIDSGAPWKVTVWCVTDHATWQAAVVQRATEAR